MADHTVGGIDRFVDRGARKPGNDHPEYRRDDRVGKILGETFDRGTRHACGIERGGVAPDNMRDRGAAGLDATGFKRRGHVRHMPVKTALRDEAARHKRRRK